MSFINDKRDQPVRLNLARNKTRMIKQGYPWIYRDWLEDVPQTPCGSRALVRDMDGKLLAFGMFDPHSPLAVRICATEQEHLDDDLILARLESALRLRRTVLRSNTTGFRLLNGEGDGVPGLVVDIYNEHAVLSLDGAAPAQFWNLEAYSDWLVSRMPVKDVLARFRTEEGKHCRCLKGTSPAAAVRFQEHGLLFQADIVHGQKTGFFFDQRDNRMRVRDLSSGRSVLNLFGYTGGFSVYAAIGGAKDVTTVDLSAPALLEAESNWSLNSLSAKMHRAVKSDVFDFLARASKNKEIYDLVIVDPPSFARSQDQVPQAQASYSRLFTAALKVLAADGIIALSSCSSHITQAMFLEICRSAFSKARRKGNVLGIYGQPEDHPFPLVCEELRYLKFVVCIVR